MGISRTFIYCLRLRHHDNLSPESIARLQLKNLRRAVRWAKRHSPFYADVYRHVDADAPDFAVDQLPPVTKEQLMENFDRVVTDRQLRLEEVREWARRRDCVGQWFHGRYVVTHTSGTTGTPAFFVYSRREWDWIQALGVTRGMRYKPPPLQLLRDAWRVLHHKPRIALISVLGGHFVTHLLFRITPRVAQALSQFLFLSVTEPLPELVRKLDDFQPNIVHVYPTMLEVLAHEQKEGRLHINPWAISTSSEPLTRTARRIIEEAFPGTRLFETYGTTEGVTLACCCSAGGGMHINEDFYILEPQRADGAPVEAGEAGDKVLVSCLFTRTMPILRYELTDVVVPEKGACDCGLPFRRLRVRGRADDIFWVDDCQGRKIALPPIPFEALMLDIDGLRQYQVIQENAWLIRVLYRPNDPGQSERLSGEIRERLGAFLRQKGVSPQVRVEVERVEDILRDPRSGKIRQIFSRVERPYLPGVPLGERRSGEDRRSGQQKSVEGERRRGERRDDNCGE